MYDNLGEQFTIDDMARTAMYSKFHFSRVFQRVTGVSPGRFLAAIRLQEAKRLLVCTSSTVTDISHRVGYTSVGTFSSRFRSSVGVSPTEYRQLGGFAAKVPTAWRGQGTHTSTVHGRIDAPRDLPSGLTFLGLFPDPIPQGVPIRCSVLLRPGPYLLADVPPGTWYLMASSVPPDREAVPDCSYPDGDAPNVACSGPITVRAGTAVDPVDLCLRPRSALDPPVLMALLDVQSAALA
ncbi:helix-turn-helix transcriptional regulator, partial [Saccharothrix sp. Mg75]|uniref:helix-turn-helix transcriptional regulator n=1 Tax=Saccharothrix sp. Mg75 TaxID=3445357 RepID=UPI003EE88C58